MLADHPKVSDLPMGTLCGWDKTLGVSYVDLAAVCFGWPETARSRGMSDIEGGEQSNVAVCANDRLWDPKREFFTLPFDGEKLAARRRPIECPVSTHFGRDKIGGALL